MILVIREMQIKPHWYTTEQQLGWKKDGTKWGWNCAVTTTLMYCRWEFKMVQPLCKAEITSKIIFWYSVSEMTQNQWNFLVAT